MKHQKINQSTTCAGVFASVLASVVALGAPSANAADLICRTLGMDHPSGVSYAGAQVEVRLTTRAAKVSKASNRFDVELIDVSAQRRRPLLTTVAVVQDHPWGIHVQRGDFDLKLPAISNTNHARVAQLSFVDGQEWRFAHLECMGEDGPDQGFNLIKLPNLRPAD